MRPMNQFLCRLLEPTPTVPIPRGRLFGDKRPWRKQVASGFLITVGLIEGFSVVGLALSGLLWWSSVPDPNAPLRFLVGWWTLPLAATIMVLTAHRWVPFAIGFFFGPALLKTLGAVIVGPSPSVQITPQVTRSDAAQLVIIFAAVIALTWRFLRQHPAPTRFLDRCAFTFFAFATLRQMIAGDRFPPLALLSGVAALFIAWLAYYLQRATHRHEHHSHRVGTLDAKL